MLVSTAALLMILCQLLPNCDNRYSSSGPVDGNVFGSTKLVFPVSQLPLIIQICCLIFSNSLLSMKLHSAVQFVPHSQSSHASMTLFPHTGRLDIGAPFSYLHSELHPSPFWLLPSSHSSPVSNLLSPQLLRISHCFGDFMLNVSIFAIVFQSWSTADITIL